MRHKVCLVTGANSGIGRATVEALAGQGAKVVMVCRDARRGRNAKAKIESRVEGANLDLVIADLSSQDEVRRVAAEFKERQSRLDVLVNNAGVFLGRRLETVDGLEATFATNHLGFFLLTNLLLDTLKASAPARIVNVSSDAHHSARLDFNDLQGLRRYSGLRAYCNSKLANVLFTYELARRLEGSGVTANALHPGVVRTNIGRRGPLAARLFFLLGAPFLLSPKNGAATSIYLATSPEVEGLSGKYFVKKAQRRTSGLSYDRDVARRMWDVSVELTNLAADRAV